VDPDIWEKIVLNLISNAFKFTLEGEIEVRLRAAGSHCELSVRDTGVGIPEAELPRIFERFHRVEQSGGRTIEGTGIGLALVQELTKLHGGSVKVESALGRGSTFTVAVPFGTAHLPAERIGPARELSAPDREARPYVEELLRWIPIPEGQRGAERGVTHPTTERVEDHAPARGKDRSDEPRPRVLLADDNADMREYLRHLLAQRYLVEAVADGQAAIEAARRTRPALVLSDIMMPRLDGFALLREIRADPGLRTVPVVLLSARAGEESRVEGLEAGADDYLVKPFSARELLARVTTNLELARFREEVEHEHAARAAAEEAIRLRDEFLSTASHELRNPIQSLQLAIQSLRRGLPENCPSASSQTLGIATRQTQRLTALITQLLDVVRIRSGRLALTLEEFDLVTDTRQILERMQIQIEQSKSPVTLHAEGVIVGRWDRSRIDQLLTNLLSNALSYGAGQPIELTLERAGSDGDGGVRITIRDRGIGIPADRLPHIFERFERATSTRHYGGLGLGLFIARQIAQAHRGTISAESELGRGSSFTVDLPLRPPPQEVLA
jgi:signal transduction histidine kinase